MISCNVNIPYYGKVRLLRQTVRSVEAQDCERQRLEVTVFDDCSPQAITGYVKEARGISFAVIRNAQNLGMVGNWNRCLEYGSRECIHVLHCDDLLHPSFYSEVLPLFEAYENVGLVHTDCTPIFTRKSTTRYWGAMLRKRVATNNGVTVISRGDEAVRHVMRGVFCSSVVLRRKAVSDVGLFRKDLTYSSDEEYWARVAARWAVGYVSRPLTIYRYHDGNYQLRSWTSEDFWDKWQETRQARMAHLVSRSGEDIIAQSIEMARLAVGISHKLLAAGHPHYAIKYLEYAIKMYPEVGEDGAFRRVSRWISEGKRGRIKAWLRSSH